MVWIKVKPTRLPRKFSCILVGCLYYTQQTYFLIMRDHIIMSIDTVIRKHPICGIILTGDFNKFNDMFLISHYRFVQLVTTLTRGQAILDKIWTNMGEVYSTPISISELGKSEHCVILLRPEYYMKYDSGRVTRVIIKRIGENETNKFARALSCVRWEPLFRLYTCEEKYMYYKGVASTLMDLCFPEKTVTRHTADKPWITNHCRMLIRNRQRAYMRGDQVNRAAVNLKYDLYQRHNYISD